MKKKFKLSVNGLLVIIFATLVGCSNKKAEQNERKTPPLTEVVPLSRVSNILAVNCYICHNPNSMSHDEIVAPPLIATKMRYLKESADRNTFINRMTAYISNPNKETTLMKGAVKRFGLMPQSVLSEDDIRAVAGFIYDNEILAPSWFAAHEKEMHGTKNN